MMVVMMMITAVFRWCFFYHFLIVWLTNLKFFWLDHDLSAVLYSIKCSCTIIWNTYQLYFTLHTQLFCCNLCEIHRKVLKWDARYKMKYNKITRLLLQDLKSTDINRIDNGWFYTISIYSCVCLAVQNGRGSQNVALPFFHYSHYIAYGPLHALWFRFGLTSRMCFFLSVPDFCGFSTVCKVTQFVRLTFPLCTYSRYSLTLCVKKRQLVLFHFDSFALSCLKWQLDSKERQQQQQKKLSMAVE